MSIHNAMIGMPVTILANQGEREGSVIAAVTDKGKGRALIEYGMPSGVTFLRILEIDQYGNIIEDGGRSCSYNAIPKKFLEHIRQVPNLVAPYLMGGFDPGNAPTGKAWQRQKADRRNTKAANVKDGILGIFTNRAPLEMPKTPSGLDDDHALIAG